MFQRAEPDEPGLGVTMLMSSLERGRPSPVMPFGLPSRTTSTTTESVTMPVVRTGVPVLGDEAGVDEARHVGLEREVDVVGVRVRRPRRGSGRPTRRRTSSR